jgi:hypothetical protein
MTKELTCSLQFDQNRRDDTDSGCLPAVLWEVDMVQATIRRFAAIRTIVLIALFGQGEPFRAVLTLP